MCCHVDQNCPIVNIKKKEVVITDDYDGSVKMTKDQFKKLLSTNYGNNI